jgi:hypothetical protein
LQSDALVGRVAELGWLGRCTNMDLESIKTVFTLAGQALGIVKKATDYDAEGSAARCRRENHHGG